MARKPLPLGPAQAFAESGELREPPPVKPYPIKRGSRPAVPDRSREPVIGPCAETRQLVEGETLDPTPRFTPELRGGVEFGSSRGNDQVQKTTQEFGDDRRERRGVRVRPVRPGPANY
jgi:hypothetical protein